ncbi:MAG: tetratricopeptide repeat protein [Xanthomonadales bacterium]|nr:tetratricopeptide repeat protein [Xanthomonadales bacterium]
MEFWIWAPLLLVGAGVVLAVPLFNAERLRGAGIAIVLMLPVLGLSLYTLVGDPRALDVESDAEARDIGTMTRNLQARLSEEDTQDAEGWLLLGRSYRAQGQLPEAVTALQRARSIDPNNPSVLAELVETRLYASGQPRFPDESLALLDRALEIDPDHQKTLWLRGLAAAQAGDDARAAELWQRLLVQLPPGTGVAQLITEQLAQLDAPTEPDDSSAALVDLRVVPGRAHEVPTDNAVLFVIARETGAAGPPLAVRRIPSPRLPLELTLTDADSMLPQRPLSAAGSVEVQARLSASGQPAAQPGDWQSASLETALPRDGVIVLALDERVQ